MNKNAENNIKICMIGHFGGKERIMDGQTVKTREIKKFLIEHGFTVNAIDTHFLKRNPVKFFMNIRAVMSTSDAVVLIVSSRGYRVLSPILVRFNKKFKKEMFDFIIGSSRYKVFDKSERMKRNAKKFTRIYVETERVLKEYKKRGVRNVKVIPNFKDLKSYKKSEYCKKNRFNACIVGRVEEEKGILDAINAIRIANSNSDDVKYYLDIYGRIGEKYKNTFANLLNINKGYVCYKGTINPSEAPKIINKYDVLLFPTYWENEGFPGVLIDAFFAATPVIATDWNDNFEILVEGKNGIKVNIKSPDEIAKAMRMLACDSKFLNSISLENLKKSYDYIPEKAMKPFVDDLKGVYG